MIKVLSRNKIRMLRKKRSKGKVFGTAIRPRMVIFKSLKHIYVQLIDDEKQHTVLSLSTLNKEYFGDLKSKKNKQAAERIGEKIAEKSLEKGIKQVVFDRNGYKYHGKIKIFADTARSKGLIF
ncbi:MAG: 50S ribosomal protein L18 [bacterium]